MTGGTGKPAAAMNDSNVRMHDRNNIREAVTWRNS